MKHVSANDNSRWLTSVGTEAPRKNTQRKNIKQEQVTKISCYPSMHSQIVTVPIKCPAKKQKVK